MDDFKFNPAQIIIYPVATKPTWGVICLLGITPSTEPDRSGLIGVPIPDIMWDTSFESEAAARQWAAVNQPDKAVVKLVNDPLAGFPQAPTGSAEALTLDEFNIEQFGRYPR